MLALINTNPPRPIIICDCCNSQIRDYSKGKIVLLNDSLVCRVKVIHKDCFNPNDEAFGFVNIEPFLRGLIK